LRKAGIDMRYFRRVFLNNSILIIIIIIMCISVPIGYVYLDNIIFNTIIVKNPEKEYNPLPHIKIKLQADGKDIDLRFSHLRAPTDDFKNVLYLYKDSDGNEYYIDTKKGELLGVNFVAPKSGILIENVVSSEKLKVKAETFLRGIINLEKYEFDGGNSILDTDKIVLSWSKHANKIITSDSIVVTMYKDGGVKSLVIKNNGFYDDNRAAMPIILDGYSDELTAEVQGAIFLINSVNFLQGTNISSFTKEYSKLEIDTDFRLYWEFVFYLDITPGDISNGIESVYIVKVNAISNDVSFK